MPYTRFKKLLEKCLARIPNSTRVITISRRWGYSFCTVHICNRWSQYISAIDQIGNMIHYISKKKTLQTPRKNEYAYMLSYIWANSLEALTNFNPIVPSGTLLASRACSVTIHTYPASVMFRWAASLKITSASILLAYIKYTLACAFFISFNWLLKWNRPGSNSITASTCSGIWKENT